METVLKIGLVAIGSAMGGLLRWTVSLICLRCFGIGFPYGTLFVNLTGSFALGWFLTWMNHRVAIEQLSWIPLEQLRLLIAVGFLGAFTTFSTFELELHDMFDAAARWKAGCYVVASVAVGFLTLHWGIEFAKWMDGKV